MKKLFLSMMLLALPILVSAYDAEVDGIYYNLNQEGHAAEVTSGETKYSNSVNIPEKFTYEGVEYIVTRIGIDAFLNCSELNSVIIPNSVTIIERDAFRDCAGLSSVTIPNSVTIIGNDAFMGCIGLTSFDIPNSVISIGEFAFEGCTSLKSITIPQSVTNIGMGVAPNCSSITVEAGNSVYDSRDNCNAIIATNANKLIAGCKNTTIPHTITSIGRYSFNRCTGLTSISIPNSVTTIDESAYAYCTDLTSITLPNSVWMIDDDAFLGCTGLKSITLSNSLRCIEDGAFSGCTNLTSISIPNSVTRIEYNAFRDCSGLSSVTIPSSVTFIGSGAFIGCSGLAYITVESGNTVYDSRENCNAIIETTANKLIAGCKTTIIPSSVTVLGDWAFCRCSSLTSITIPNSVTSIESGVFQECTGLTSISIPNSVTTIGVSAYSGCTSLTSIIIGNSVTTIRNSAFWQCSNLQDVYCYAEKVPSTNINCFDRSLYRHPVLYVPAIALNEYKNNQPWSRFWAIKAIEGDDNKCATPTISYADKRLTFSCETEGVEYHYTITDSDIKSDVSSSVDLSATYEISVYATKSGYTNSDVATATLVWTDAIFTETTETPTSAKAVQESIPVLISAKGGNISVKCEADGQEVNVYTIDGLSLGTATVKNGEALISTSIPSGDIAVVKVGGMSVKVIMR